ncbi:Retrovirus-related Pol polyprotein from transposon TNT 1-94 [Vitis vinifera]|uniref:Retrovirus-related Pol polyprotein from transposon TNT 1-94 n=1 Tax=Vitis vinifera TaxID=29760 RepID=A0A438DQQ4_VITVI|nr:Retrovirus-related Pol polyprotein from transposon TNT 1-94 [Vitis vinifera]
MRMAVSNSTGKEKLKYNDIRDLILAEEIHRRDADETLGSGDFGKVYLADGSALDIVGLGDVRILLPNGSIWLLEKVRHIPDLRRNLIYVGQLDDEGHAILFVGGIWKVTKGARVLALGKKTGTLYMTSCLRDTIAVADASTDTSLWHRRLGHMNEKGMKMLLSKGKLPELKSIDFDMCESCILGKQKNVSFLKTDRTPKAEKLELVQTDLWEPSPVSSLGGSMYYITFIDDSSRKGIRMEKTIRRTPQQNGVAECMNRTLNERARSMRLHAGLPKLFGLSKLDAKSKICFFIGYGDEKFGYRSIVVSDVIEINQNKSEFVNLDELTESTVQKRGEEDKENVNSQVDLSTHVVEVRRSSRNIRPPQRYSPVLNYLLLIDGGEPECYDEALQDENSSKWELAMKDEMDSLLGNQTWKLTELPLDVKTTFLHGDLEEDLYMIQPEGFIVQGQENLVCKLRKSLLDIEKINNLKKQLSKQFAMKDLGAAKQILGMRIIRDKANGTLKLSQSEYVKKVLSRPDIAHAVGVVSKFMSRPEK